MMPHKTLAVILGASVYPEHNSLEPQPAFERSASAIFSYLQNRNFLGLPKSHILNLFDSEISASDLISKVGKFVKQFASKRLPDGTHQITDLILYYVGHGFFAGSDRDYHLAVKRTDSDFEGPTSINMKYLAYSLKIVGAHMRMYVMLDCCFAGAANKEFQSGAQQLMVQKTLAGLPRKGSLLLCSSGKDLPSMAPSNGHYTMFTGSLLKALTQGSPEYPPHLSFKDLEDLVWTEIQNQFGIDGIRPELHCPNQKEGNLTHLPLFPNQSVTTRVMIKERGLSVACLTVSSPYGGELFIDGEKQADLEEWENVTFEVPAGTRTIRLVHPKCIGVRQTIVLKPNESRKVSCFQEPLDDNPSLTSKTIIMPRSNWSTPSDISDTSIILDNYLTRKTPLWFKITYWILGLALGIGAVVLAVNYLPTYLDINF